MMKTTTRGGDVDGNRSARASGRDYPRCPLVADFRGCRWRAERTRFVRVVPIVIPLWSGIETVIILDDRIRLVDMVKGAVDFEVEHSRFDDVADRVIDKTNAAIEDRRS